MWVATDSTPARRIKSLFGSFKGVQPSSSDMRFDLRFHVSERPFVQACSRALKAVEVYSGNPLAVAPLLISTFSIVRRSCQGTRRLQGLMRCQEGLPARGRPTIDSGVNESIPYLGHGDAARQRASYVNAEFLEAPERR
jgi:hypothetical protein